MRLFCWVVLLTGAYPFWRAWYLSRRTSLIQAVHWAMVAWFGWTVALAFADKWSGPAELQACYLALCLTGCAGIAVLGARRPGMNAWNFVVVALLAMILLPLAEGYVRDRVVNPDPVRLVCIAATISFGIINYLPTRFAPASILLLIGCTLEFIAISHPNHDDGPQRKTLQLGWICLAFVPWLSYWCIRGESPDLSEFDRRWLSFRNRFGFLWAERLRDQFNRSAAHANWPVVLRWQGLRVQKGSALPPSEEKIEMVKTLVALMKRFGPETVAATAGDERSEAETPDG